MKYQSLKNLCMKLGTDNKPTYAVMAIAGGKAIFRPLFTMMDKQEKPETKKYTALREALTEIIAVPAYWACGEFVGWCSSKFITNKMSYDNFLAEDIRNEIKAGIDNDKIKTAIKEAKDELSFMKLNIKNNMRFIGVCMAALLVIPGLCSAIIKPIASKIIKPPSNNEPLTNNHTKFKNPNMPKPSFENFGNNYKNYLSRPNVGLRVGGV